MEDHHRTDATLALVHEMHATHPDVGAVIQAYLRRSADDVAALIAAGTRVRLCKGAYEEPASVAFPHKADVDNNYGGWHADAPGRRHVPGPGDPR